MTLLVNHQQQLSGNRSISKVNPLTSSVRGFFYAYQIKKGQKKGEV